MTVTVAAWGGGVNSTAMIVVWLLAEKPLDLILFADTGGEKPETYAYRDTFAAWIDKRVPFYTVKGNYRDPTLEAESLRSRTLPSLAYGFKKCSLKWKRQPQDAFCNNWDLTRAAWKRGEKVVKLIGYDAGEERRAKIASDEKYDYCYPLIELGMDRKACVSAIVEAGLPSPPKSSCFFCPASREAEILDLSANHPDLLQRALAIEAGGMSTVTTVGEGAIKGLGRSFAWRDVIATDRRQGKLFAPEIACDCYDEGEE